ncbi:hypothetical protein [Actinomadura algeriensis]|uniref:FAD dependent oxidoreductase n=1 Tax=Actinomadura algeriensis TaxID=1679523 RepID=A0ABR9K209_9ACTN|nr:hypothetical protein [Actinomadura algeriensis]MBE1536876.1 hypothetical protein [Actinomadura algeriensis]
MSLNSHVDVVIIGFGVLGAAAALVTAGTGARVLALDRNVRTGHRPFSSRTARSRDDLRAELRAAALDAGVEVRTQCRVHELAVDAGRVVGVGYATLPAEGRSAARYRRLQAMSDRAPARLAAALDRAADEVWPSVFRVDEVACSRVVLALHPRHWEFVGTAVWAAAQARRGVRSPVSPEASPVRVGSTPELAVRRWCAAHDTARGASGGHGALCVEESTGQVLLSGGHAVRGLLSAVRTNRAGRRPGELLPC